MMITESGNKRSNNDNDDEIKQEKIIVDKRNLQRAEVKPF